jgi:hypothetical protein
MKFLVCSWDSGVAVHAPEMVTTCLDQVWEGGMSGDKRLRAVAALRGHQHAVSPPTTTTLPCCFSAFDATLAVLFNGALMSPPNSAATA